MAIARMCGPAASTIAWAATRNRPRAKLQPEPEGGAIFEQIGGKIPLSPSEQTVTRRDLTMAGYRSDTAIAIFYGSKVIGSGLMLLMRCWSRIPSPSRR